MGIIVSMNNSGCFFFLCLCNSCVFTIASSFSEPRTQIHSSKRSNLPLQYSVPYKANSRSMSRRLGLVEPTRPAIPMLLAVGTVHQHLIENGLRMSASIIADTAQCFSTHHFACLIGYGASAICPHLALETCRQWRLSNKTVNMMRNGKMPIVTMDQAQKNYRKAVNTGLLKVLSKMGISLFSRSSCRRRKEEKL